MYLINRMKFSFFINIRIILLYLAIITASHPHRRCAAEFYRTPFSIPPEFNATGGPWDGFHNFSGCRAGQRFDGLGRLKKYFNYFGYIPAAPGNFSDEFDGSLESAVKLYQRNFRLNTTGQLDDATLRQIVRPRCGVADIINGTNSMVNGTASSQLRTVAHYTFFYGQPRWPSYHQNLTYAFLSDNQLSDTVRSVFARAFARWANVIPLNFTETSDYYDADITIGFFRGDHGDGEPFDGVLGTLAHSFSPTNGRLHLDADETWVVTGDVSQSPVNSAVDLESVAIHEIGHVLGLGHSADEDAIMYPVIPSKTRKVKLSGDDVDGVQSLYGSNPSYNASEAQSDPSGDVSGASDGGGWLLSRWLGRLLGLAAVVVFHLLT